MQVGDVARLAAEEVARLKGQLADLDRKNRLQVRWTTASGSNKHCMKLLIQRLQQQQHSSAAG